MKRPTTIQVPKTLVDELLRDVERLMSDTTKKTYTERGFTLASVSRLAKMAGYDSPCAQLNRWTKSNLRWIEEARKLLPNGKRMTNAAVALEIHRQVR